MSLVGILLAIFGPFLYISLLGGLFVYLFKKRLNFPAVLPLALMATTLFVFTTTIIFDSITVGFLLSVFGASAFIPLLIRDKDRANTVRNLLFTPGFAIFCILYIFIVALSWFKVVPLLSDTSMHWAPHVWTMWLRDDFYTSPNLSIVNNGIYPPATQLFELLILRAANVYHEGLLFIAIQILGLSMLLPISERLAWRKIGALRQWLMVGLLAITIVLLPLVFFVSDFYFSLEVDAILGIIFAYSIYLAFSESRRFTLLGLAKLSIAVSFLCLTKQIAVLLAGLVALTYVSGLVITYRHKIHMQQIRAYFGGWRRHWTTMLAAATLALLPLLLGAVWSNQVVGYKQPDPSIAIFNLELSEPLQIPAILAGNEGSDAQQHFSRFFVKHVLFDPGGFLLNYLSAASYMQVAVMFVGIICILLLTTKSKPEKHKLVLLGTILFSGWLLYCFAIYCVFLFGGMKPVELMGKDVSNRYLRTYLFGMLLIGAILLLRKVVSDYQSNKSSLSLRYFVGTLIITFGLLFNTGTFAVLGLQSIKQRKAEFSSLNTPHTVEDLREIASLSDGTYSNPDKITVTAKSDAERHYLQYKALPNRVSLLLPNQKKRSISTCDQLKMSDYLVIGYAEPVADYRTAIYACVDNRLDIEGGDTFEIRREGQRTILREL